MEIARLDLVAYKKARFFKEFQLIDEDGQPILLLGKVVRVIVKESRATEVELMNGSGVSAGASDPDIGGLSVEITDISRGMFNMHICADDTDIEPTYTVYDVYLEEQSDPGGTCNTEKVLEGVLRFDEGV